MWTHTLAPLAHSLLMGFVSSHKERATTTTNDRRRHGNSATGCNGGQKRIYHATGSGNPSLIHYLRLC
uniref:Putative secreted peptide n=1 Tax=Anopheles braziliensis TaxID=58242 RepID=A0A2M3ZTY1_9DIPT